MLDQSKYMNHTTFLDLFKGSRILNPENGSISHYAKSGCTKL